MYEKWLSDDGKSLELNRDKIRELKKQIEAVKSSQDLHEQKLNEKADALGTKEDILMVSRHVWCLANCRSRACLNARSGGTIRSA